MVSIVGGLLFIMFYAIILIPQIPQDKRRKRYYYEKSKEYALKGEMEKADMYGQLFVQTKTLGKW